jgi:hypothetical protein
MAVTTGLTVVIAGQDNSGEVYKQLEERILRAQQKSEQLNTSLKGVSHAVPEMAAASGAIRELEGNLPIRAVERFLSTTLGLGDALAAAFPIVGAVAFGGIILENVEALVKMYQTAVKAGEATRQAFADMHDKAGVAIADLQLQNDKLQDEIDKISGHPNNGIKTALDEAKKAAEELLVSLVADRKEIEALLKEHETGNFVSLVTGMGSTGKQDKELIADQKRVLDQVRAANDAFAKETANSSDAKAIRAAADVRNAAIHNAFQTVIDSYRREAGRLRKEQADSESAAADMAKRGIAPGPTRDNSQKIANVEGLSQHYQDMQSRQDVGVSVESRRQTLGELKQAKENGAAGDKTAEALAKVADANRKLQEARADEEVRIGKASADKQLAQLEDSHKQQLVSEENYSAAKLAIQKDLLAKQAGAATKKSASLDTQIAGLQGQNLSDTNKRKDNEAKVIELQAEQVKLAGQVAEIKGKSAALDVEAGTAAVLRAKDLVRLNDQLAARRESASGGSVEARQQQIRDQYVDQIKALELNLKDAQSSDDSGRIASASGALENIKATESHDLDATGARGAEEQYGVRLADLNAQRSAIGEAVARGTMTSVEAQRQKVALDQQEVQLMQQLLPYYQQLAADGDLDATKKVIELGSEMAKLSGKADVAAAQMRQSFDGAFEGLFDNLDQGTKALESFAKDVQRILEQELYRKVLEPVVQNSLGSLIPDKRQQAANTSAGSSPADGVGSTLSRVPVIGSLFSPFAGKDCAGNTASTITIQLLNETGTPFKIGDLDKLGGGDDKSKFEAFISDSFNSGGIMRQLLSGGG